MLPNGKGRYKSVDRGRNRRQKFCEARAVARSQARKMATCSCEFARSSSLCGGSPRGVRHRAGLWLG
jgi:hypothetical protein